MNVGGPAWQVSVLAKGVDPAKYPTQVVTGRVGSNEQDFLQLRDPLLEVNYNEYLGRAVSPFDDIRALWSLIKLMRKTKPAIVHTHTAKAGTIGRLAAIVTRVPIRLHTYHGHVLAGYFSPSVTKVFVGIERMLARYSTVLVSVGEKVREDLLQRKIGSEDRFVSISPGVADIELPNETAARAELGIPNDVPLVLFVGRLTAIKRVDRLIDAFEIILAAAPSAVLAIVGDGDLAEDVRNRVETLGESVRLLGWRPDLANIYGCRGVTVLTSDNEGMPVALIESSMAGNPSVVTDVGSAREVVIDGVTGFVVRKDSTAIAQAVLEILDDPIQFERMGNAAKLHATTRFSAGRLASDYQELYDSLIQRALVGRTATSRRLSRRQIRLASRS